MAVKLAAVLFFSGFRSITGNGSDSTSVSIIIIITISSSRSSSTSSRSSSSQQSFCKVLKTRLFKFAYFKNT